MVDFFLDVFAREKKDTRFAATGAVENTKERQ